MWRRKRVGQHLGEIKVEGALVLVVACRWRRVEFGRGESGLGVFTASAGQQGGDGLEEGVELA